MTKSQKTILWCGWLALSCAAISPGCGPGGPPPEKKFQVTGTVNLDGKPVENGLIKVLDLKRGGDAGTIKNGAFSLQASPGEKRIEITATAVSDKAVEGKDGVKDSVSLIPEKYNTKSELKETVKEGTNTFKFELKSK